MPVQEVWPEGGLLVWCTSRGLQRYSQGMEAHGRHFCDLLCLTPGSPRKNLTPLSGTPILGSCYEGIILHHLAQKAGGASAHGSNKTTANGEKVLKQLSTPGHSKKQKIQEVSLPCERGLLA